MSGRRRRTRGRCPEAHPRAAVPDPGELLLQMEGDAGWSAALLRPSGRRVAVFHRPHVGRVACAATGCALHIRGLDDIPNEVSATVHHRMPVIVQPKDYALARSENQEIADILAPSQADGMIAYSASKRVNLEWRGINTIASTCASEEPGVAIERNRF